MILHNAHHLLPLKLNKNELAKLKRCNKFWSEQGEKESEMCYYSLSTVQSSFFGLLFLRWSHSLRA